MSDSFLTLEPPAARRVDLPFRMRFRHSRASRDSAETLLVALTVRGGPTGYGQILTRDYVTGETLDQAEAALGGMWRTGFGPLRFPPAANGRPWLELLDSAYREADAAGRTASYSGLEIAAIDALARANRIPGAFLWGGDARAVPLVGVVPAVGPRKAALLTGIYRTLGYRRFKVKVGDDPGLEAARVGAVRRAAGRDAWLALDANAAWDRDEAPGRLAALLPYRPALIEEPLRHGREPGALRALEEAAGIETMADESLVTLRDAERFLETGGPSWWNLRIAKSGGFSGVGALGELAKKHGVKAYGGVLVGESSALAAAGRACLGLADFECMEYGFPRVLLKRDPFHGGPGGFGGVAHPLSGRPGLGVRPASATDAARISSAGND